MVRPKTPLDLAESKALVRIASLASHIMVALRQQDRANSVSFTIADLSPALAMLEATGRIRRAPASGSSPRPGWLPTAVRYSSETEGTRDDPVTRDKITSACPPAVRISLWSDQ
jgi:hypothetical protein